MFTFQESEGPVRFPPVNGPPDRDLYPREVGSPEGDPDTSFMTNSPTPALPELSSARIRIAVTSPVLETVEGRFPGLKSSYHSYLINTTTTMRNFQNSENAVRRRFRDFVALSNVLNENYRGCFVPPRPHRSWYKGKLLKRPKFIEERRVLLERYLRALASHPTISLSDELRVFLETRGRLMDTHVWHELKTKGPTILEGTGRFIRQMSGRERITPSASEMSKPANLRRDFVWSLRESLKNLDTRRKQIPYSGQEFELREERLRMEDFKKDVETTWKAASTWIDRIDSMARASDNLAAVFNSVTAFENDSHYLRLDAPGTVANGAEKANDVYNQCLKECTGPLSTIHSYTEMMRPVLAALRSREKALSNVQLLQHDLDAKKTKLEQLRIQPSKETKINQLESDIEAVQKSYDAAKAYYEHVATTNIDETNRFRTMRADDWMKMFQEVAQIQNKCYKELTEIWSSVSKELGADPAQIEALNSTV